MTVWSWKFESSPGHQLSNICRVIRDKKTGQLPGNIFSHFSSFFSSSLQSPRTLYFLNVSDMDFPRCQCFMAGHQSFVARDAFGFQIVKVLLLVNQSFICCAVDQLGSSRTTDRGKLHHRFPERLGQIVNAGVVFIDR